MGGVIADRRRDTSSRIDQLKNELAQAEKSFAEKACVYATGSFGRGEASRYSDLDLFIVGLGERNRRELSRLDEIRLEADLIEATRKLDIPEFSGDGEYLTHYTKQDLIDTLGKPHDDASNTFTARLLLLLESRPLLGENTYHKVIAEVIAPYWGDYTDHKNDFIPAFLANDILRLWRTFCVNYEARTSKEPEERKAKRKLKNYKLKHSRLLTCYSALLYLLAIFARQRTVHPSDAVAMTEMSPTARLEWLIQQPDMKEAHGTIRKLLEHYEDFLEATDHPEQELIALFLDADKSKEHMASASTLGNLTFEAIEIIGQRSALHRILIV
jgi:predicted nucleotidyltransferase